MLFFLSVNIYSGRNGVKEVILWEVKKSILSELVKLKTDGEKCQIFNKRKSENLFGCRFP